MHNKSIFILLFTALLLLQPLVIAQETQTELPSFFSWTDINNIDYSTPIKNQAPAPTCEAYALCAAIETLLQYQTGELYIPDLSETHLYFYAGGTYESGYVNIVDAANYLIDQGVPDEGCYPDPHRPYDYPFTSLDEWQNRTVKITEWGWVEKTNNAIKQALIEYGPLAGCFYLYKDFNKYQGGVYSHKWGKIDSGHVMSIFGYDDEHECWIIKNSWGTRWGDNGWIQMKYDSTNFAEWYGEGTGIMFIDGVYGTTKPDVPKVYIQNPKIYHSYIFGSEFFHLFQNIPGIQEAAPRIIGPLTFEIQAENTERIEIFVDNQYTTEDSTIPFNVVIPLNQGAHTIKVIAYDDEGNSSIDIRDVFKIY